MSCCESDGRSKGNKADFEAADYNGAVPDRKELCWNFADGFEGFIFLNTLLYSSVLIIFG